MELTHQKDKLFAKIEPELVRTALYYRLSDARGEARSWYERFSEIIHGFDEGRYKKDFIAPDGRHVVITDESSQTDRDLFQNYLTGYMVKSFSNSIKRDLEKAKRNSEFNELMMGSSDPQDAYNAALCKNVFLDDLIDIVREDSKRLERNITSARDRVNFLFLEAVTHYLISVKNECGNIPIIRDYDSNKTTDFFISEVREGKLPGVRKCLEGLALKETNPQVKLLIHRIIVEDDKMYALSQKIYRYFKRLPARLRKISEQRD